VKWWRWLAQALLAVLLLWFVGRSLAGQWQALRTTGLSVRLQAGWLALSLGLALLTFWLLIQSWGRSLAGWGHRLGARDLAETWFIANLGRYLPGKLWSVAGMVVLATRKGVPAWAATAGAVAIQAVGLGTAAGVVLVTLPGAASGVRVVVAAVIAAATLVCLSWGRAIDLARRWVPRLANLRPLPPGALAASAALTVAGWIAYGVSFWALSRGLGQPPLLPIGVATGVFALGYTIGLLALFAPGGAVVREAVFVALLAPYLGAGPALALSLASRLVLTVAELVAAAPFLISYTRSAPSAAA